MGTYYRYLPGTTPDGSEQIGPIFQGGKDVEMNHDQFMTFATRGAVAARSPRDRAADVLRLEDFVASGDIDDTAALQRMIAAWSLRPAGGYMLFPTRRPVILSGSVSVSVANGQVCAFGADGGREARLRYSNTFNGVGLSIGVQQAVTGASSPLVRMEGLEFISETPGQAGQCFSITGSPGGNGSAAFPSSIVEDIRATNEGGGCWAQIGSFFAMNVTRTRRITGTGFNVTSVGLVYDTDTRISVEHDLEDFYMNGGGTGLKLGNNTIPALDLQGFTLRRHSYTGTVNGIVATCVTGLGQLLLDKAQFNCSGVGFKATNCDTIGIHNAYFLSCGLGVMGEGGRRYTIGDNKFLMNAPTSMPGNGVNNLAIVLHNINGPSDSGSIVSGNIYTGNVGATPGLTVSGYSNYVFSIGNQAIQGTCFSDTTGNPSNCSFADYDHGGVNGISFGQGVAGSQAGISLAAGNLTLSAPVGNVKLNQPLILANVGSSASSLITTDALGEVQVYSAGLKLSRRIGNGIDTPGVMFDCASGGTSTPLIQYNPTQDKFVFYSKMGAAIASLDVNGNLRCAGTVTGSVTP